MLAAAAAGAVTWSPWQASSAEALACMLHASPSSRPCFCAFYVRLKAHCDGQLDLNASGLPLGFADQDQSPDQNLLFHALLVRHCIQYNGTCCRRIWGSASVQCMCESMLACACCIVQQFWTERLPKAPQ